MKNKVAIITGAASGIGRAAALRLAKSGANVGLIDLKEEKAEKVKEEIEKLGVNAIALDVDLSDPKRVEEEYSRLSLMNLAVWISYLPMRE